ncbi:hypothetical protein YC2023_116642 [Brassica napus]
MERCAPNQQQKQIKKVWLMSLRLNEMVLKYIENEDGMMRPESEAETNQEGLAYGFAIKRDELETVDHAEARDQPKSFTTTIFQFQSSQDIYDFGQIKVFGIKPIRPGASYLGNHHICRLGASYPRTLSWEYQQPSASTMRHFDPPFLPLLDLCVISSNNQSSVVSRDSPPLLFHHSIHQFSFKPSEFLSKSG